MDVINRRRLTLALIYLKVYRAPIVNCRPMAPGMT